MSDTSALITRLEVIAKRYALNEVKEAAARIAELEAALKPFADLADEWRVTEGDERFYIEANVFPDDLRAARAAYLGEEE